MNIAQDTYKMSFKQNIHQHTLILHNKTCTIIKGMSHWENIILFLCVLYTCIHDDDSTNGYILQNLHLKLQFVLFMIIWSYNLTAKLHTIR